MPVRSRTKKSTTIYTPRNGESRHHQLVPCAVAKRGTTIYTPRNGNAAPPFVPRVMVTRHLGNYRESAQAEQPGMPRTKQTNGETTTTWWPRPYRECGTAHGPHVPAPHYSQSYKPVGSGSTKDNNQQIFGTAWWQAALQGSQNLSCTQM